MSVQDIVPRGLGRVHSARRTPWVAILFTTALAMALASTGSVADLASTTVVLLLIVFTFVNISVLIFGATSSSTSTSTPQCRGDHRRGGEAIVLGYRVVDDPDHSFVRDCCSCSVRCSGSSTTACGASRRGACRPARSWRSAAARATRRPRLGSAGPLPARPR